MTVSQEAHHHFLVFFLGAEDNNKPLRSSSSLGFFLKCRRWWQARRLPARCHLLGFFSNVSSLVRSLADASLYLFIRGDVTTPFLSHHTFTTICRTVAQTHISLRVASILKNWATTLFFMKEIPCYYYNFEFVSFELEDLWPGIDLYTFVFTSIRLFT